MDYWDEREDRKALAEFWQSRKCVEEVSEDVVGLWIYLRGPEVREEGPNVLKGGQVLSRRCEGAIMFLLERI
jgi:hypothetical protein